MGGLIMQYYDPTKNPLNKYKLRNLVKSLFDSEYFLEIAVILGVIAVIVHHFL